MKIRPPRTQVSQDEELGHPTRKRGLFWISYICFFRSFCYLSLLCSLPPEADRRQLRQRAHCPLGSSWIWSMAECCRRLERRDIYFPISLSAGSPWMDCILLLKVTTPVGDSPSLQDSFFWVPVTAPFPRFFRPSVTSCCYKPQNAEPFLWFSSTLPSPL